MDSAKRKIALWAFLAMTAVPIAGQAESLVTTINPAPVSELWLNPGMYTYHFQTSKHFNNSDFGFGFEYRYSTTSSFTAGVFDNSERQTSHYVGWYWQPVRVGKLQLGAGFGGVNGYPSLHNRGWFPAILPTATIEFGKVGMNVLFIPIFNHGFYGALSFQLKIRAF
jgi:hypothetical protein